MNQEASEQIISNSSQRLNYNKIENISSDVFNVLASSADWKPLMGAVFGPHYTHEMFVRFAKAAINYTYSPSNSPFPMQQILPSDCYSRATFQTPQIVKSLNGMKVVKQYLTGLLTNYHRADEICVIESIYETFLIFLLGKDFTITRIATICVAPKPVGFNIDLTVTEFAYKELRLSEKSLLSAFNKRKTRKVNSFIGKLAYNPKDHSLEGSKIMVNTKAILKPELYPNLPCHPKDLMNDFMKSSSGIILFIGSAGSGKSSLIRAAASKYKVTLIDDHALLQAGTVQLVSNRILEADEGELFVFEEVTPEIATRNEEITPFVKMLLQVSSGIVKAKAKIAIATNNASVNVINQALVRSDRTYGVFQFKDLTPEQANAAARVLGKDEIHETDVCLSDVFNGPSKGVKKGAFGFGIKK